MNTQEKSIRVLFGSKILGPMSREELSQELLAGNIAESALVSEHGSTWRPIASLVQEAPPAEYGIDTSPRMKAPTPPARTAPAKPLTVEPSESPRGGSLQQESRPSRQAAPGEDRTVEIRHPDRTISTMLITIGAIVILAFGGFYFIAKVALESRGAGQTNAVPPVANGQSQTAPPVALKKDDPVKPDRTPPVANPNIENVDSNPKPAPKKKPEELFRIASSGRKEDAIAVICATKAGAEKTYLPLCTAFAIDSKTLCTRAYRLAALGAFDRNAKDRLHFVAISKNGLHEIDEFRLHPKFPIAKLNNPDKTDLFNMFVNDVALISITGQMDGSLGTAKTQVLGAATQQNWPGQLLVSSKYGETWDEKDRCSPVSQNVSFVKHPDAPGGSDKFASVEGAFQLAMDGGPVIDQKGRVVGLMAMVFDQFGLRPGPQTVISIERAHEILDAK